MFVKLFDGKYVSVYGLLGIVGFLLGGVYLFIACKKKRISFEDTLYVYVWAGILTVIGAKLLYIILDIGNMVDAFTKGGEHVKNYIISVMSGGLVFYGGLIGGFCGALMAAKFFKYDIHKTINVLVPTVPLIHAFGRIGCNMVGCCYGIKVNSHFGKKYTNSLYAPNNVYLFPVQLIESMCNFLLFAILAYLFFTTPEEKLKNGKTAEVYLLTYSVIRFILEFFRGDEIRGHFLAFSTSQWISIMIFISVVVFLLAKRRRTSSVH
ncbi:prolipoprotein diacylglyceryl transferase [Pseudobutyrivibrio sp.]|uniref:prolipoprotein diacylglyceryl transferase n=1 Tax=Pseudobutyrivibrio sp. TaxID=2014367 RepID=UPI0025ECEB5F|nr:prolipoprotein diacylglyceryl transferase family protein [Pseudobutyrivibrio sp.]